MGHVHGGQRTTIGTSMSPARRGSPWFLGSLGSTGTDPPFFRLAFSHPVLAPARWSVSKGVGATGEVT